MYIFRIIVLWTFPCWASTSSLSTSSAKASTSAFPKSSTKSTASSTYTYSLVKNAQGRPTPLSTQGQYVIPVANASSFVAYANSRGVVTPQFSANGSDGSTIILTTRNASRVTMFLPNGNSAIIDNSGVRVFNASMSTSVFMPVPNLKALLAKAAAQAASSSKPASKRSIPTLTEAAILRRSSPVPVPFEVDYHDQCGSPVAGHTASAICDFRNAYLGWDEQQTVALTAGTGGAYTGSCVSSSQDYVDDLQKCKDTWKKALDYPTSGLLGDATNFGSNINTLQRIFSTGIVATALRATAKFFTIGLLAGAIEALAVWETFLALGGDDLIADALCNSFNNVFLAVDSGLEIESGSMAQVNVQTLPPFTSFTATRTVSISTVSCTPTSSSPTSSSTCPPQFTSANETWLPCNGQSPCFCGYDFSKSNKTGVNVEYFISSWDGVWYSPCYEDSQCNGGDGGVDSICTFFGAEPCCYYADCVATEGYPPCTCYAPNPS